jgi:hypothetical protein
MKIFFVIKQFFNIDTFLNYALSEKYLRLFLEHFNVCIWPCHTNSDGMVKVMYH